MARLFPSLSLRALGIGIDDPLAVTEVALRAGFWSVHLHLHKPHSSRLIHLLEDADPVGITWLYPLDAHASSDKDERRRALHAFEGWARYAAGLGVETVSTWLPTCDLVDARTQAQLLKPWFAAVADAGLRVAVELETGESPSRSSRRLLDLFELVEAPPLVTLDTHHLGDGSVLDEIAAAGVSVPEIHVAARVGHGSGAAARSLGGLAEDAGCRTLVAFARERRPSCTVLAEPLTTSHQEPDAAARAAYDALTTLLEGIEGGAGARAPRHRQTAELL